MFDIESGPAVDQLERALRARGTADHDLGEALAWIDERSDRLREGEDVAQVLADQARFSDRAWYTGATQYFDNPMALDFLARNLDFGPSRCCNR